MIFFYEDGYDSLTISSNQIKIDGTIYEVDADLTLLGELYAYRLLWAVSLLIDCYKAEEEIDFDRTFLKEMVFKPTSKAPVYQDGYDEYLFKSDYGQLAFFNEKEFRATDEKGRSQNYEIIYGGGFVLPPRIISTDEFKPFNSNLVK